MANPTISDGLGGDVEVESKGGGGTGVIQAIDPNWVTDEVTDTFDSGTATAALTDNSLSQPGTLVLALENAGTAVFWMRKVGTVTGGRIYLEATKNGGTTWVPASATNGFWVQYFFDLNGSQYWNGGEAGWRMPTLGFTHVRFRLDTAITGAGDVVLIIQGMAAATQPFVLSRNLSRIATGTIDADEETVTISLEGTQSNPAFTIFGTWTGTILFEGTLVDGTSILVPCYYSSDPNNAFQNGLAVFAIGTSDGVTACGHYVVALPAGLQTFTLHASAWTSGSATVVIGLNGSTSSYTLGAISGDKAHDGADLQSPPAKVGLRAISFGANPTGVAAADRTNWYGTRSGQALVLGGHPNVITLELAITGAQTDTAVVTVSSGAIIVVTQAQVLADNANTAFPQLRLGFGTANTPTTTGVVLTHPGIPAGGGVSRGDGSGILGFGADGSDLRVTCGAPTGGSLRLLVSYFTVEG